jgi:long-chain acyl-CoA synthetase
VIVPNVAGVRDWAAEAGVDLPEGAEEICEDERVQDRIAAEVERTNEGFESYERIKKFVLAPEEFTEHNDLLTPTMKKKRRNIIDRYEGEIERLYAE